MKLFLLITMLVSYTGSSEYVKKIKLKPGSYLKWYNSQANSMKDTVQIGELLYTCEYVPIEVDICKQLLEKDIDLKSAKQNLKMNAEPKFILKVFYNGAEISSETKDISHLNFGMKKQFHLTQINSEDTLRCIGYHVEKGISDFKMSNFSIYFESINQKDMNDINLTFEDNFFSNETIRFHFNVAQTPKLVL